MTISPTAVVVAVWFLTGLGLHQGDGVKGTALRKYLGDQRWGDLEAVEKRIATLGLLLAGKWLDDNSFLTKSWYVTPSHLNYVADYHFRAEVTGLPVKDIDQMERYALADYHYSLYIPTSAWADHVNNLYSSLLCKNLRDEAEDVILDSLDKMVTEAREIELTDTCGRFSPVNERRISVQELPAAGEQATSRDWGTFARSYAINEPVSARNSWDAGMEFNRAERIVHALVVEDENMDEQEEDEFLDYDGAKPWLPSVSEMRRSASDSSAQSFESVAQWRAGVSQAIIAPSSRQNSVPSAYPPIEGCAECARGQHCSTSNVKDYPISTRLPIPPSAYKETGVYLEPGIAIIRPPTAQATPKVYGISDNKYSSVASNMYPSASSSRYTTAFGYPGQVNGSSNVNRWGTRDQRW